MSAYEDDLLHQTVGWRLTSHARRAALSRGYSVRDVLLAVADPEVSHTSYHYGPGRMVHKRADIQVVLDPHNLYVITVLLRSHGEWTDDEARGRWPGASGMSQRT